MQPSHRTSLMLLATLLISGLPPMMKAASDAQDLRKLPPQYEAVASRLRSAQPQQYDFSKAMLADVLRFLATDAGISFFSLPDDSELGSKLITFSINASPFKVLETLCRANGLAILPDNDIWCIRPADDRELEGKSYEVRHNALERVEKITGNSAFGGGGGAGGGQGGGGGGGQGGGQGGGGLSLQGPTDSFAVQRSEIINDIRAILDLPPEEMEAMQAATMTPGMGGQDPNAAANATNSNELSAYRRPKVIWKSDSNTLYVVATRLQHLWVEGYLAAADKVQPMIAIEVKFLETARDPRREFGVDWTGTFENGTFRQVDTVTPAVGPDGTPFNQVQYNTIPTQGGFRTDLAPLLSGVDLNDVAASLAWPQLSILSAQDINVKLRALLRDSLPHNLGRRRDRK